MTDEEMRKKYPDLEHMPTVVPDPQWQPGTFGCHEALHMASVARDFVDKHLCDHPSIEQNPEWAAQARNAAQALFDLYQMIGAKHVRTNKELK